MFQNRMFALALVPALAFTMYACGPKPEEQSTTTTTTTATTTTETGTPSAPPAGETGTPGMETPAVGGVVSEDIVVFVEEFGKTKGKDGKLQLKKGEEVLAYEFVEVQKTAAQKTPDGKNAVPTKMKGAAGEEVVAQILVIGETKADAKVDSLVMPEGDVYTWSETDMMFLPAAAGTVPPADGAAAPPADGAAAPPADGAAPAGDAAAPAPGETPATN